MRKQKCPEPECYDGEIWDEETNEDRTCPRCQGMGWIINPDADVVRFRNPENVKLAAGFLQSIRENPYDEDVHQIFADWLEEHGEPEEAAYQRAWTPELQEAEDWFDDYAIQCQETRESMIEAGEQYLDKGRSYCIGTDTPDIVYEGRQDFWRHFAVLTGREVPVEKREDTFIRCAC